ncbi:uncharacterized protein LOC141665638 [Apium graveolens]|uniref:uncharacterized protein LOC141665638 n=1 Tax=Apium graveolens TaxID=4045 RepID=UPI003D7A9F65
MEKLVYALILASRKLRPYFQAHRVEVRTAYPLRQVLHKPESSGRMLKWVVELGQLDLEYVPRTAIKGQALADFLLKFDSEIDDKALVMLHPPHAEESLGEFPHPWCILHMDGAVNNGGAGAGIVLVSPEGHHLMSVIYFKFYATNNGAEYEALINGLKIALEMGVRNLIARSDSELVVNLVNGGFQARGPQTELYLRCVQRLIGMFKEVRMECVPREKNSNADALACDRCQRFANYSSIPATLLTPMASPWPFSMWGIDLIGELPKAKGDVKFGIPYKLVSDNGKQFDSKELRQLCEELKIKKEETPFMLTYGYEAMVPVEVGSGSLRRDCYRKEEAEFNQRLHLDLLEETRENSQLRLAAYQQRATRYYNKKVKGQWLKVGDLVLRKVMPNTKKPQHGVFGANWEGPYRIKSILWKGTYHLEDMEGKLVPRAWNAEHLRKYYQ